MPNRLILKVTKFQLPPPKRLGIVVKNIWGGHHARPCQIVLNVIIVEKYEGREKLNEKGSESVVNYRLTDLSHVILI